MNRVFGDERLGDRRVFYDFADLRAHELGRHFIAFQIDGDVVEAAVEGEAPFLPAFFKDALAFLLGDSFGRYVVREHMRHLGARLQAIASAEARIIGFDLRHQFGIGGSVSAPESTTVASAGRR